MKAEIAILGGSGALGSGLAYRLSRAGREVVIGTRDPRPAANGDPPQLGYAEAAAASAIAILTVPFVAQQDAVALVAPFLRGKILVDATVPLVPPAVSRVQLPPEGSAALRAQAIAGPEVRVVSAFQNVAAERLKQDGPIDCDVLVTGDDPEARARVVDLVTACGMRGLQAGPLANAVVAEALTSVLIAINRSRKIRHAGIRITGLDSE